MQGILTLPNMASLTSVTTCWSKFSLMMAMLKALPTLSLSCQCLLVFAAYVARMWFPCHMDVQNGWHSIFQKNLNRAKICFSGQRASLRCLRYEVHACNISVSDNSRSTLACLDALTEATGRRVRTSLVERRPKALSACKCTY